MKFDPNEPAYPEVNVVDWEGDGDRPIYGSVGGFTKREALIKGTWEALLANSATQAGDDITLGEFGQKIALAAIVLADALILELSKEQA